MSEPLLQMDLPGIPKIRSGKVRELFDLGDDGALDCCEHRSSGLEALRWRPER